MKKPEVAGRAAVQAELDRLQAREKAAHPRGRRDRGGPPPRSAKDAIAQRLTDQRGLVYRYLAHDGLAGEEGTFLLCTFWLAQAQALAGQVEAATATFERAVAAINDVGLLAEEVAPRDGEMIGNFPQAFSHIGLINAAWAITEAQQRTGRPH